MRIYLYQCHWTNGCRAFKYKITMTLMRLQKPVYITIGKFSPLNVATFIAVSNYFFKFEYFFNSIYFFNRFAKDHFHITLYLKA